MDRTAALELAASLPKGDPTRREILARLKGATAVILPRVPSSGPSADWYLQAELAVMRDHTLEVRGLENKILMMAWDLGYEFASGGRPRHYKTEWEKLRHLARRHDLEMKAEREWKDGQRAFGKNAAAKPRGKVQEAVMAYLDGAKRGQKVMITDMVRHPSFRGVDFGKVLKAVGALAKAGLVESDDVEVSKKASSKTAGTALNKVYIILDALNGFKREFPDIHKERAFKDLQKALFAFEDVVSKHELKKYGES